MLWSVVVFNPEILYSSMSQSVEVPLCQANGNIVGFSLAICVWIYPDMRQKERPVTFSKGKIFPVVTCLWPTRCGIITTVPRTVAAAWGCQSGFSCVLNVTLSKSKMTLKREGTLGLLHRFTWSWSITESCFSSYPTWDFGLWHFLINGEQT